MKSLRFGKAILSGTDIVVNEACKGIVEKLNFTCASTQAIKTGYIKSGLVVHYDGVDNNGYSSHSTSPTSIKDLSGNTLDGTITNCTVDSNSMVFNGTGKIVNTTVKSLTEITFEIFLINTNDDSQDVATFDNGAGSGIAIFGAQNAKKHFFIRGIETTIANGIPENAKTSYVCTLKSDGTAKVYLNNVLKQTLTVASGIVGFISLGILRNAVRPSPFVGNIYEVRVYDRVLSDSELTNNYNIDVARFINNDLTTYSVYNSPGVEYPSIIYSSGDEGDITIDNNENLTNITLPSGYVGGSLPNGVADTDLLKKVGKVVLNGSESWSYGGIGTNTINCTALTITGGKGNSDNAMIRCDKLTPLAGDSDVEHIRISSTSFPTTCRMFLNKTRVGYVDGDSAATIVNKAKTWLSTNNVTVYYELSTPTSVSITTTGIPTYEGINTITTTNNIKPSLAIEAWKR